MNSTSRCDVAVVGAGLAGLMAARELHALGADVVVFEASSRLGGRAYRREFDGAGPLVEFGGTWLLPEHEVIRAELSRYGIDVGHTPLPDRFVHRGSGGTDSVRSIGEAQLNQLVSALAEVDDAATLGEALRAASVSPAACEWIGVFCRYLNGSGVDDAAATTFAGIGRELLADLDHYNITIDGGTSALVAALAGDGPPVLTGRSVTGIRRTRRGYAVEAEGADPLPSSAVVVATPANTWANLVLPADVADLVHALPTHPGASVKLWIEVDGVDGFVRATDGLGPFAYVRTAQRLPDGQSLLVGFGTAADFAGFDFSPAGVEEALTPLLPGVTVRAVDWHDWNSDPLFRGAWLAKPPGYTERAADVRDIAGRLVFAGADISAVHAATLDGALASGQRVAQLIATRLGLA